jgi:hypothetical protein
MSPPHLRAAATIALLDADPDLGADIAPDQLPSATAQSRVRVIELEPTNTLDAASLGEGRDADWLGLYVIGGLVLRRVSVVGRNAAELFGPGDLLRPWDLDGSHDPLPVEVQWVVSRPTRIALLDGDLALRLARWPSITSRLISRAVRRSRYLALSRAFTHHPRVYVRLLVIFWLMADRWGRVVPGGVRIELPLTHETLAMLVGAHRPTVTIALQRLRDAELLTREASDRWLLTKAAIEQLERPEALELAEPGEATAV